MSGTTGAVAGVATRRSRARRWRRVHPLAALLAERTLWGIVTIFAVSVVVFAATVVLPGNTAQAVLGSRSTPAEVQSLERQLHLNQPAIEQYWTWLTNVVQGNLGSSLALTAASGGALTLESASHGTGTGDSVSSIVMPRLANSAVLVAVSGLIGVIVATGLGVAAAVRESGIFDNTASTIALAITSLPEFVIAIAIVMLLATNVWHLFPAVSVTPPSVGVWTHRQDLVLPVLTLAVVIVPYMFRMIRASMIEALHSEYVELATLKGLRPGRVIMVHALPNAIPAAIQVVGLSALYLAGGIVVVEYVFNFPGIGQGLVAAVTARDIPTIQAIVVFLAAFYVVVNMLTDVATLAAIPRRRLPRSR